MHRVHSRAALIHFLEPRVGPCYDEDDKVYEELENLICDGELSKATGWEIGLGRK